MISNLINTLKGEKKVNNKAFFKKKEKIEQYNYKTKQFGSKART